jgi:predicted O-linked N-acetylglucosamine transferase (SPINDLY family)
VSPDFRGHSVSYFVEPLLAHADRKRVTYTLFSTGPKDQITERLKSLGHTFYDFFGRPKSELKERIQSARLDILVDLCGPLRGGDLELLRARLAPLQMNYCGYPNTLGLKSVDYRLVDEVTDPSGWSDAYAAESLIRIKGCFLSFAPRQESLDCDVERVENLPPTFGSFNAARKISDQYLSLCRAVLELVPESRLIFKSMDFRAPECEAIVRERAGVAGIDQARLTLLGPSDAARNHLESYRHMHVALDTYPYSGTTTTCEALLMGVPVVTLMGRTHPSRVSASLLRAAGIEGCVAETAAEYAACAARHMELEVASSDTRRERQRRFLASELCDGKRWAAHFEAALRSAWQKHLGAQAP